MAPVLLRHHLRAIGHIDIFDANAYLFEWLLGHRARHLVRTHVEHELLHLTRQSSLGVGDLTRLGHLLSFRDSAYLSGAEMSFARTGMDWAPLDYLMLREPLHERDTAVAATLWRDVIDAIAHEILALRPEHIGFSLLFYTQSDSVALIAQRLRAAGHDGQILLGGAVLKLADEVTVRSLMERCSADLAFRFNVYGEPEGLAAYLSRAAPATAVAHGYTANRSGASGVNKKCVTDRVLLPGPIDYSGLNAISYQRPCVFPVLLSEGCYWGKCEFCDYPYLASQDPFVVSVMFREPAAVIADSEAIQRLYGANIIDLISDAVPLGYFRRLRRAGGETLRAQGIQLGCSIRAEPRATAADYENMAASGVDSITIGIESLCDEALQGMQKGNTYDDVKRNLAMAKQAGLRVKGNFIYDYPRHTVQSIDLILERLDSVAPMLDAIGVHSFSLSSRAPAAFAPAAAGLRVLGARHSTDHGDHHLAFVRTHDSAPLVDAHERLRQRLNALAYQLAAPHTAQRKTYRLPFSWRDSGAIQSDEGPWVHVQIPSDTAPFSFYVCDDTPL